jgi:hypothetical protein
MAANWAMLRNGTPLRPGGTNYGFRCRLAELGVTAEDFERMGRTHCDGLGPRIRAAHVSKR